MTEVTSVQCPFCGAPVRELRDGACPFCGTMIVIAGAGPTAPPTVPGIPPTAPGAGGPPGSFAVVLTATGRKKINVIKTIREATGLGLKEAKDLADGADHGAVTIVAGLGAGDASALVDRLARDGATAHVAPG
ncbi:MAG: ribosomal protein L7/L12 [Acidimicrobiales bacterium]